MTIPSFSKDGKKSGTLAVPKIFSDTKRSNALLHQVVTGLKANLRRGTAHTKTRGDVSGGGRKPWRQKGTGRARAGSIRSPLWRGGGTTFGPRSDRNYEARVPTAMKKTALKQVLAQKIKDGEVFTVASLELSKPKTRLLETYLQKLPLKEGRILVVTGKPHADLARAGQNLPYLTVRTASLVNLLDLLTADSVVVTKDVWQTWEKQYGA